MLPGPPRAPGDRPGSLVAVTAPPTPPGTDPTSTGTGRNGSDPGPGRRSAHAGRKAGLLDNRTTRRVVLGAVVVVALGCFVVAGTLADTDSSGGVAVSGDVVERLIPVEDEAVLQQERVGVDLAAGWSVSSISVNGVNIPENEWDVTAELGLYQVIPGEGRTLERLQAQQNCAQVVAFQLVDLTATETISWCFTAT